FNRVCPMRERKIRILLGKLGEGHNQAILNLAKRFGDAGFEVIYTELQEPQAIVRAALQESVDHIGITTLPGADITVFENIRRLLQDELSGEITMTAGGFLKEGDFERIKDMGVMEFFSVGTPFEELIEWAKKNIRPRK
ncbi:MAG: cobalamin-dependent protein, partial [Pseudomonadota bacterium]